MPRKPKPSPPTEDRLELRYVPVATVVEWERNAKKHDVGALWESIQRHGFRDPSAFDVRLNEGRGGIVEGNGRSHVLKEMQTAGEPTPRGILVEDDKWLMPVLFGLDAESERAAEAYGIAHNNLTLMGGDFGPLDINRLWEPVEYAELLANLAAHDELPVGIDGEDVDALIGQLAAEGKSIGDSETVSFEAGRDEKEKPTFGVFIACEGEPDRAELLIRLRDEGFDGAIAFGTKPKGCKR